MGKSQSKLQHKKVKHACTQLFENLQLYFNDPNNFTKIMFIASLQLTKKEIDTFIELNENSKKLSDGIRTALKFVSKVFDKDFEILRKFNGHYDNDFYAKAHAALDSMKDLNLLLINHNLQNINLFKDKFRRSFLNLFLWFTAASLRVDTLHETKINTVLTHLATFQNSI